MLVPGGCWWGQLSHPLVATRIFVAGHRVIAGSAICRAIKRAGYPQLLSASRSELNLLDGPSVEH